MHNALAVVASLFFLSSLSTAFHLPQFPFSSPTPHHDVSNKCTFTLWHKQTCFASKKTNYIQIFEIRDHTNDISIDVASLRPPAAHNSYIKISPVDAFAIEGLLHGESLVVSGSPSGDETLRFVNGDVHFDSDMDENGEEAWCVTGAWDNDCRECGKGSRERRMDCAFPCQAITDTRDEEYPANVIELR